MLPQVRAPWLSFRHNDPNYDRNTRNAVLSQGNYILSKTVYALISPNVSILHPLTSRKIHSDIESLTSLMQEIFATIRANFSYKICIN